VEGGSGGFFPYSFSAVSVCLAFVVELSKEVLHIVFWDKGKEIGIGLLVSGLSIKGRFRRG
jgi:hypothetical protein